MRDNWTSWIVLTTLALLAPAASALQAEEPSAAPIQVEVLDTDFRPRGTRSLERFSGFLSLQLRVTNPTTESLTLTDQQLQFTCDSKHCPRSAVPDPLLQKTLKLEAGESAEGWVGFTVQHSTAEEPALRMQWKIDESELEVDLNEALRRLTGIETATVGPQNVLTIVTVHRTIDLLTIWQLRDLLKQLKADGTDRLVIDGRVDGRVRLQPDVAGWLASAQLRQTPNRFRGFRRRVAAPVQFTEFHVSGFEPRGQPTEGFLHRTREHAVAEALATVYQRLPVEEAVVAMNSDDAGIRRAALVNSIDRLTAEQLNELLNNLPSADPARQLLLIEHLDRVSHPAASATLRTILLSALRGDSATHELPRPTVSAAALTLVRCIAPDTEAAVAEVWSAADADPELRYQMIQEILRTKDYRWVRQVAEFASLQLDRFSSPPATRDDSESASEPRRDETVTDVLLSSVLRFLHANDTGFIDVARLRLLSVTLPDVQDVLLDIVLDHGGPQDSRLASACIEQRLDRGSITREMLDAVRRVPDSRWTDRLLDLRRNGKIPGHRRVPLLLAVMSCANDAQLGRVIDDFTDLDRYSRTLILQQMVAMDHPRCIELFTSALESDDSFFGSALQLIPQNPSPEILKLLLHHLEPIQRTAQSSGSLDARSLRRAQQLLLQIAGFDHPEAQRQINVCLVSPVLELRRDAGTMLARNTFRSPVRRQLGDLWNAKKQQEYDESLNAVHRLIEQDPYYSEFYIFRASLLMRHDHVDEALSDIETANQLSPGDVITESTLALAHVRTGRIDGGLKDAEAVLERVPEAARRMYMWTLYNTACVYGRAVEQPTATEEDKQRYLDRAWDLLSQSADAGIYDADHVLNDPDLVTLHDHSKWESLIQQITDNLDPGD